MLPSQTVENYLKTIYLAQTEMASSGGLVPMGQVANALGVVPGTATTMVKTLAESGLVRYEPYMGVRLTAAGEKLASRVLRRHRLIELFLVKVLGMTKPSGSNTRCPNNSSIASTPCWAIRSSIRTAIRSRPPKGRCRTRQRSIRSISSVRRSQHRWS